MFSIRRKLRAPDGLEPSTPRNGTPSARVRSAPTTPAGMEPTSRDRRAIVSTSSSASGSSSILVTARRATRRASTSAASPGEPDRSVHKHRTAAHSGTRLPSAGRKAASSGARGSPSVRSTDWTASARGRQANRSPPSTPRPRRTAIPLRYARVVASPASRDFPIPGSPDTTTTSPRPLRASFE